MGSRPASALRVGHPSHYRSGPHALANHRRGVRWWGPPLGGWLGGEVLVRLGEERPLVAGSPAVDTRAGAVRMLERQAANRGLRLVLHLRFPLPRAPPPPPDQTHTLSPAPPPRGTGPRDLAHQRRPRATLLLLAPDRHDHRLDRR